MTFFRLRKAEIKQCIALCVSFVAQVTNSGSREEENIFRQWKQCFQSIYLCDCYLKLFAFFLSASFAFFFLKIMLNVPAVPLHLSSVQHIVPCVTCLGVLVLCSADSHLSDNDSKNIRSLLDFITDSIHKAINGSRNPALYKVFNESRWEMSW